MSAWTRRRAMEGLWVGVQPIVSFANRQPHAYEVLVRTHDPDVPHSGAFIALAARVNGMIHLDRRVRDAAAALALALPEGARLFVNLHTDTLSDPLLGTADDALTAFAKGRSVGRRSGSSAPRAAICSGASSSPVRDLRSRG